MTFSFSLDLIVAKWNDSTIDSRMRIQWLLEMRNAVENLPELTNFINLMMPLFLNYLSVASGPKFQDCPEHRIRLLILEIINRFPNNHEALRMHAVEANSVLMNILENDNEENALVALRIFIDLHRNFRAVLEEKEVQPFLDFVVNLYENLPNTVQEIFDSRSGAGLISPTQPSPFASSADTPGSSTASDFGVNASGKQITKSSSSFKVLTECPIIIVILFQLYRKYVANNIPRFVEVIIQALKIQVMSQIEAQKAAQLAESIFVGVSPQIKNRVIYGDFIASQVKTLSFLAYIIRSYSSALRQHQTLIPGFIIQLLQNCPPEACGTRKELLVATRHILSTDFRQVFVPHLKIFLDPKVLIGTGLTAQETLKPLSYSLLADFIHHVRMDLSLPLISLTIQTYTKNLHDPAIPISIQTMSAKLLVNLVDSIVTDNVPQDHRRHLLIKILSSFVAKFSSIKETLPHIVSEFQIPNLVGATVNSGSSQLDQRRNVNVDAFQSVSLSEISRPIKAFNTDLTPSDVFRDLRFLLKTLISGLKNILFGLRGCNQAPPLPPNISQFVGLTVRGFSLQESELFLQLLKDGICCFDMYHFNSSALPADEEVKSLDSKTLANSGMPQGLPHASMSPEEKEMLDQFAHIFTVIDPAIFQDIFSSEMEYFISKVHGNLALLTIPQYILAVTGVSQNFASILLRYLMDRLESIGTNNLKGQIHLRLFKLVFLSVTVYPDENESVLQPHLGDLINWCLKNSSKANEPLNYFVLLRSLFRSIGGGRYESLYKEVLPLLPVILEQLNVLLSSAPNTNTKELFVELVLTVPVRLSVLLPHLQHLMRPLVLALKAGPELVAQGLRTLELCVDNLRQDFLDPILMPVIEPLMEALWMHLKPAPYNSSHSQTTLRILGKLGGRNRRLLKGFPHISYKENVETGFDVKLKMESSKQGQQMTLSMDTAIKQAVSSLDSPGSKLICKRESLKLLKNCVSLLISNDRISEWSPRKYLERLQRLIAAETSKIHPQEDQKETILRIFSEEGKSSDSHQKMKALTQVYNAKQGALSQAKEMESPIYLGRLAQSNNFEMLLSGLFVAASIPELSEDALPFLRGIYVHFTLLKVHELLESRETKCGIKPAYYGIEKSELFLDTNPFAEAIVASLAHIRNEVGDVAEGIITLMHETADALLDSKEVVSLMPVFYLFASRFCSHCYKTEWYYKRGGCRGIRILASTIDFGLRWIWMQEMKFVRALLYILKDNAPDFSMNTIEEAKQTLSLVLKICNRSLDSSASSESLQQERQAYFGPVICLLITELSNARSLVRESIQSSLELLSELNGCEVSELLTPYKDRLLNPIYMKPLRALPFTIQIGHIDAVTYCLSLRPPFITFNDEFLRLLHEALALADAEDHALVSKSGQFRNASSLISLRVVCLKLMSTAMGCDEFQDDGKHSNTRNRIISIFFKSLYARSSEIVEVAKKGLQKVITHQHKLPKELLQNGLRPILMNLSNHKSLTVPGLEGLARLLELLTSYFKVEIGKKLYEHLSKWAEPEVLEEAANKTLSENNEVKVMVAIMNVFHLLPPTANIFMDSLILMTAKLDSSLRRVVCSPFHLPLIKYLHVYTSDSIDYFLSHIDIIPVAHLFIQLFRHESANMLRHEAMQNTEKLLEAIFSKSERVPVGIQVIKVIGGYHPEWIDQEPLIMMKLMSYWKENVGNKAFWSYENVEGVWSLFKFAEPSTLLDIILTHIKRDKFKASAIFDVLVMLGDDNSWSVAPTLKNFLSSYLPNLNVSEKTLLVNEFFEKFQNISANGLMKVYTLRWLVIPLVFELCTVKDGIALEEKTVVYINSLIWNNAAIENDDICKIEYLQLTSILLDSAKDLISAYKKDIIRFGWSILSRDDPVTKQAAYVMVSKFIKEYETPQKMVLQVLVTLSRASGGEIRTLVKQALDIFIPSCVQRLNSGESEVPSWIRVLKKVITEEAHSTAHLILVWQVILSNYEHFYEHRDQFICTIINSLVRIGLTITPTIENKNLTVDLTELILVWEQRRLIEKGTDLRDEVILKDSKFYVPTTEKSSTDNSYELDIHHVEVIVSFLIRLACPINDSSSKREELLARITKILKHYLLMWPDINIKYSIFEKLFPSNLVEITVDQANQTVDVLTVIDTILSCQSVTRQITSISHMSRCLETSNLTMVPRVNQSSKIVFQRIGLALSSTDVQVDKQPLTDVVDRLNNLIFDLIANNRFLPSALSYLEACVETMPSNVEKFLPTLSKLLPVLCRDYLNQIQALSAVSNQANTATDFGSSLLISLINLMRTRVDHQDEMKRSFLGSLTLLADRNVHKDILTIILKCCKDWFVGNDLSQMTGSLKDRIALIQKLSCLAISPYTDTYRDYLELIASIYEETAYHRTELTVKLEPCFLLGLRHPDWELRSRFYSLFDSSIEKSIYQRLFYIFATQNWEPFSEYFWIHCALDLMLNVIPSDELVVLSPSMQKLMDMSSVFDFKSVEPSNAMEIDSDFDNDPKLSKLNQHVHFINEITRNISVGSILGSLQHILFDSDHACYFYWVCTFPYFWKSLGSMEQEELRKTLVPLLSKEYHLSKQSTLDLNVIQAILDGFNRCSKTVELPPQLVKYLGKNFKGWHLSLDLLQKAFVDRARSSPSSKEDGKLYEMTMDALCEMYNNLGEDDMEYGLWRRRCIYGETNAALSFEQQGMWEEAQKMYELAENKARLGAFPFTESEYCLWEDHWIKATQRLQQWDVLNELAKYENNSDLGLECAWRLADWSVERDAISLLVKGSSRLSPTKRKIYDAFLCLSQPGEYDSKILEFNKHLEEGVQHALSAWHKLPSVVSSSHVPLLILFQQLVELQEASTIYNNLTNASMTNRTQVQNELKGILVTTWRERLPNLWEDIHVWSDLVAWRQHVFSAINKAFQPFANDSSNSGGGASNATFAYRGYHETAWIINRFAHVARKHDLNEVCINSLSKIYTLPNIEIQDAFLKLREQAKCYFNNPQEFTVGLEIINQTNLGYFVPQQKAEFFALKGIFLWKMNMLDEANKIFSQAVHLDMNLGKGWASWGQFNDQRFQSTMEITYGCNAINCYLQAATIYQNARARKFLARVLWLLSFEDSQGSLSNAFDLFNNELPPWYWVTFIPQLLTSLTRKEGKQAKNLLQKIAKTYPQALYFPLRTAHEDYRQHVSTSGASKPKVNEITSTQGGNNSTVELHNSTTPLTPHPPVGSSGMNNSSVESFTNGTPVAEGPNISGTPENSNGNNLLKKTPLEYTDELMTILKTGSPLLALSMESMVDHISQRLRATPDEDLYRIIVTLRYESLQQSMIRLNANLSERIQNNSLMELSLVKVSEMLGAPNHFNHRYKQAFDRDFIESHPSLPEIVNKLQKWREKLEPLVNKVPKTLHLENFSRYLVEFEYQKYEEVEVPGQYLLTKDNNDDFVKIARFDPQIDIIRKHGTCYRRITIHGHDGSKHPFIVQNPAARHARREERIMQLFRILNSVLDRRKESRKRNLNFHMPTIVPLSTHVRIIEDDLSYVSMEDVYERHCEKIGIHPDDVVLFFRDEMTEGLSKYKIQYKRGNPELLNLRQNLFERISSGWVPDTILSSYMASSAPSYQDLWMLRKQFTLSYATLTFLTYVMGIGHRFPHKTLISRSSGSVLCMDLLPSLNQSGQFTLTEAVPFRLTPNIQNFITPVGLEGIFTNSIMAIARCLTEPEFELEDFLSIFVRDELITWFHAAQANQYVTQIMKTGNVLSSPNPINASSPNANNKNHNNVTSVGSSANATATAVPMDTSLDGEAASNGDIKKSSTATTFSSGDNMGGSVNHSASAAASSGPGPGATTSDSSAFVNATRPSEIELRNRIAQNVEFVLKRAQALSCLRERDNVMNAFKSSSNASSGASASNNNGASASNNGASTSNNAATVTNGGTNEGVGGSINLKRMTTTGTGIIQPVNQTILDLISAAVNPQKLCQMDAHWHPWL